MPRRQRKNPSNLSLKQQIHKLQDENEALREGLEQIADILEELGILEGESENPEDDPSNLIEGEAEPTDETTQTAEAPQPLKLQSS